MKKFILMAAIGLLMSLGVNAQKQGYINVSELLSSLPAFEKAKQDLASFSKPFEEAYATMEKEYETKVNAFKKDQKTMSDAVKEMRISEIQDLEARIMKYRQDTEEKLANKERDLLTPIYQSIEKAINDYAKTNGFDYVFTQEALLYAKDSENLTNALITKMGGKKPAPKPAGK